MNEVFDWLMINIDNYNIVKMVLNELQKQSIDITGFKNLYTLYLLPSEPVDEKMLIKEIKRIQKKYDKEHSKKMLNFIYLSQVTSLMNEQNFGTKFLI